MISEKWLKKYELAKKYYEEHDDLLIPANYIEEVDGIIIKLGDWINTQRKAYKNINNRQINKKQIKMLEEIDMVWNFSDLYEEAWLKKYELAKKYYEEHGDLLIAQTYVVNSNNKKTNLGTWINTQRMRYKGKYSPKLKQNQIELLEDIGMIWDIEKYKEENIDKEWLKKYELAKKYYEEHGNLLIVQTYVVTSNNKKINLGTWISAQRMRYKGNNPSELSYRQIKMLEDIGMVWELREYKKIDKFLLEQYMLYEQNKLNEDEIVKLLEDGAFVYGDSDKLQKVNTLEFYRKKY